MAQLNPNQHFLRNALALAYAARAAYRQQPQNDSDFTNVDTWRFERIFELTENDTASLFHDEAMSFHWFNPQGYSPATKADDLGSCCFFSRRAFQESGGWNEDQPEKLTLVRKTLIEEQRLRLFKSPNNAMRFCRTR